MPKVNVTRESRIVSTFRVEQVRGMFDIPNRDKVCHEWDADVPIEGMDWRLGVIVGPSGSGKTTLARELFPAAHVHSGFDWPAEQSVVDGFGSELSAQEITGALSSVGFSSPPYWLKPYAHLSNGQKFRCELARCILLDKPVVVFDEFTSVVDRDVAKVCSAAVAKFIRRRQAPRFVAVSCHYDILDWLEPDWVFDVGANRFESGRLWRRPTIELHVCQVHSSAWRLFRGHHYLSAELSKSAKCFAAFWGDRPVAFTAVLPFPHAHIKRARREHRTVVSPDFQGVGIGNRMSEFIADFYGRHGFKYFSTTSHPAMIRHRAKSPRWKMSRAPGRTPPPGKTAAIVSADNSSAKRLTASFEYVGHLKKPSSEVAQPQA